MCQLLIFSSCMLRVRDIIIAHTERRILMNPVERLLKYTAIRTPSDEYSSSVPSSSCQFELAQHYNELAGQYQTQSPWYLKNKEYFSKMRLEK